MSSKVLEWIEKRAISCPDAKAIVEHDYLSSSSRDGAEVTTSYGDMWEKSARIARALLCFSEKRNEMVGVAVNEGSMLHVCQVAVLRAGKTFVPISIDEGSRRRLNAVCELCEFASVVVRDLTQKEAFLEMLDASERSRMGDRFVVADDVLTSLNDCASTPLSLASINGSELFISHVFFTSGSTGVPKGCVVSEKALFSYCVARNKRLNITEKSAIFMASSSTFDPSYGDALSCFVTGGALHVGKTKAATFEHLGVFLKRSKANFCALTPSLASTLSDADLLAIEAPLFITLGGERASTQLLAKLMDKENVEVANTYGVTECTVYQTFGKMRHASDSKKIGEPLDGVSIVLARDESNKKTIILDPTLDRGKIGEIYISGEQVGEGYFKAEVLTRERFVTLNDTRYFRTGDFAKYDEESERGELIFLGRKDSQVKINGVRIELEEVESLAMAACESFVSAIAACALSKSELVLFCCVSEDSLDEDVTLASIKTDLSMAIRWCISKTLPKFMRPKQIFILDEPALPLSANGKIDRRLLLSDEYMGTLIAEKMTNLAFEDEGDDGGDCLETPLDFAIADAFRSALDLDANGAEPVLRLSSNFVFLGGDSLGALSVVRKLKETLSQISTSPSMNGVQGSGIFGEDFGALSPHELLQRPVLLAFASHLASTLDLPETWTERNGRNKENYVSKVERHSEYETSLIRSLVKWNQFKVIEAILQARESEERSPIRDEAAVCLACQLGHAETLDTLISYGGFKTDLELCRGARRANLLHCTARNPAKAGRVLAILAQTCSESALAKLVQSRDEDEQTPLHAAARYGCAKSLINDFLMLSKKPQDLINARDRFERTPLHWASVNGHKNTLRALLEFGADKTLKDANDETALDAAERRALCASNERIPGERPSKWADIATVLGGSGSTRHLKAKGIKK